MQVNEADMGLKDVKGSHGNVEEEAEPMEEMEAREGLGLQGHYGKSSNSSWKKMKSMQRKGSKAMMGVALPFLQGVSPAGFLSASRRQPGGSDRVIQVMWLLHLFHLHLLSDDNSTLLTALFTVALCRSMGSPTLWPRFSWVLLGRCTLPIDWRPTSPAVCSPAGPPRRPVEARAALQHPQLLLLLLILLCLHCHQLQVEHG